MAANTAAIHNAPRMLVVIATIKIQLQTLFDGCLTTEIRGNRAAGTGFP